MIQTYMRLTRVSMLGTALVPLLVFVSSHHLAYVRSQKQAPFFSGPFGAELVAMTVAIVLVCAALIWLLAKSRRHLTLLAEAQGVYLDGLSGRSRDVGIAAAAGLSLFLELAVIRWHIGIFSLLAFYKNFSLLACFAGLGLGYALAARKHVPLILAAPLLGAQIVSQLILKYGLGETRINSLLASPITEQLNMGLITARTPVQFVTIYLTLGVVFLITAMAFLPVGQLCGRLMMRTDNLRAYGLNLLGSLAGVALMLLLSYLWSPPVIWFALVFAALTAFQTFERGALLSAAAVGLGSVVALSWPAAVNVQHIYSPYQLIEREYTSDGLTSIRASGLFFQRVHNFSGACKDPGNVDERRRALYYELPFRIVPGARQIAVVGAGTGNDVAAALRMGVGCVDAVEIDPAIVAIGDAGHPEHPYSRPGVRIIVNDARSFFRGAGARYNMIVYGLLDSHAVLSSAASVRLDSFVYTVEGFREARERLTENGVLSLSFFVLSPELGEKIFVMLRDAFGGRAPVCLKSTYSQFYTYLASNGAPINMPRAVLDEAEFENITDQMNQKASPVDPSTDDWPFFYMPHRVYPFSYLGMVAVIFGLTVMLIAVFTPTTPHPGQSVFFFLGAGFMLVETKGITELGLQFGNTWHVIGIVLCGILLMAFLANYAVIRFDIRRITLSLVLLMLSLGMGLAIAWVGGFPSTWYGRVAAVVILTCPLLFSGIVFSTALRDTGDIAGMMAANLLGAMCGGLLEYNAMRFGYHFLYFLAMALYALAALSLLRIPTLSRLPRSH